MARSACSVHVRLDVKGSRHVPLLLALPKTIHRQTVDDEVLGRTWVTSIGILVFKKKESSLQINHRNIPGIII